MYKKACVLILALSASPAFAAGDGVVTLQSEHSVQVTTDRLEAALEEKGMTVFARIDHAGGAKSVDMELAPTEQIIFGNPSVGTPLMHCERTVAIDLPQKMLIFEDDSGRVQIAWNDPEYVKARHRVSGCDDAFARIAGALEGFATAATSK